MNALRPCINCCAFHYGYCSRIVRQCWTCHRFGHIQRYCPTRKKTRGPRGKLLPGSKAWCQVLGLDNDLVLQRDVRRTLKDAPGATIFLNDECIYRGVEIHFYRKALPQGPELIERLSKTTNVGQSRGRSRSPSRERIYKRSRSLVRRYSHSFSSPRRTFRTPSLLPRHRYDAPEHDRGSSPPVYSIASDGLTTPLPSPNRNTDQSHGSKLQADGSWVPLAFPKVKAESIAFSHSVLGTRSINIPSRPAILSHRPLSALQQRPEEMVPLEDPYFVLGIANSAPKSA